MIAYKKILFPIDLSLKMSKVVPHVKTMADRFEAEVHVVYVAKTNEYYREDDSGWQQAESPPGQTITRMVIEFADVHCEMLDDRKVVVLEGDPATELLEYIHKAEIDLVMMGTKGRSALGKALLGSVVVELSRNAVVPVMLIRPDEDKFLV